MFAESSTYLNIIVSLKKSFKRAFFESLKIRFSKDQKCKKFGNHVSINEGMANKGNHVSETLPEPKLSVPICTLYSTYTRTYSYILLQERDGA